MDFELDDGWQVLPIEGDTGTAYMGVKQDQRIFLKRNPSPFLAALSIEGITPRLIWTRRTTSGDTLIAQKWLNGRCLTKEEMKTSRVRRLLYRVHHSDILRSMLRQVGGQVLTPSAFLRRVLAQLTVDLQEHPLIQQTVTLLQTEIPRTVKQDYRVCHTDLNHRNLLLSAVGQLYLVDWDHAIIADPAIDLGMLLADYVPLGQWDDWLTEYYGHFPDRVCRQAVFWYATGTLVQRIATSHHAERYHEMNQALLLLKRVAPLLAEQGSGCHTPDVS